MAHLYHRHRSLRGLLVLLGLTLVHPAQAQQSARLTLQSQPGDYVGQGGNFDITYPSNEISTQIRRTLPGGDPAELLFVLGLFAPEPNTIALLFFGTDKLGIPIQPGVYTDAQTADVAEPGHPGLDVSFQGRGCNLLTGSFTIGDVSFFRDDSNTLEIGTFSASFEQRCEGSTSSLFGTFFYRNAQAPTPVPEPGSLALLVSEGMPLLGFLRRRRGIA